MRVKATFDKMALVSALTVLGLAGCSFSFGTTRTVSADKVATTAEDALEESVGQRPNIDCGTEDFDLIDGETRDCVLTGEPGDPAKYQAVVTIDDVDLDAGTFHVDVKVADQPLP